MLTTGRMPPCGIRPVKVIKMLITSLLRRVTGIHIIKSVHTVNRLDSQTEI
jgi:hypothetical protein